MRGMGVGFDAAVGLRYKRGSCPGLDLIVTAAGVVVYVVVTVEVSVMRPPHVVALRVAVMVERRVLVMRKVFVVWT